MKFRTIHWACMGIAVSLCMWGGCGDPGSSNGDAAAPPPPPRKAKIAQPRQTYDYSHSIQHGKSSKMSRKLVVALVRFAEDRPVEDVPYGVEGESEKPQGESATNIEVNVLSTDGSRPDTRKQPPAMSRRSREMLKHELMESDSFVLVERERILDVLREQKFGETRYVNPETSPEIGEVMAVQYLLEGSIGPNEDRTFKDTMDAPPTYKDGGSSLAERLFNPSKASQRQRLRELTIRRLDEAKHRQMQAENSVGVYLSLYDVRTSRIAVEAFGIGGNSLEAIRDAVEELIDECLDLPNPVRIVALDDDRVFLDIGEEDNVRIGQQFRYMIPGPVVRSSSGQVIGNQDKEGGELEIIRVDPLMCVGKVTRRIAEPVVGSTVLPLE